MRIRIALTTAVAVTLITAVIFALTNSSPVASAKGIGTGQSITEQSVMWRAPTTGRRHPA